MSGTDVTADITTLLGSVVETQKAMFDRIMAIEQRVSQLEADHAGIKAALAELDKHNAAALVALKRHDDTLKAITVQSSPEPLKRILN